MNRSAARFLPFASLVLPLLAGNGCVSPNVNPAAPQANKAYLDFYAKGPEALAWSIREFDAGANQFQVLYRDSQPLPEGILRLALPPGNHRLEVSCLNRVILEPATIELVAVAGTVTPVEVQLSTEGTALVRTAETQRGPTYRGRYGRATAVDYVESHPCRVRAAVQAQQPYQRKERMPYHESKTPH